ncbi:hypothetical protein K435DRAFT_875904 [Dendrothele bispora CBS 962.96]|uniref:Uncharacterized protein n=1 Tax=Dendrothele bispora (strain CBS 962.96) TaxID=1314807 RepID=A0A4S8KUD5_DENBC|nr:hypothetical protein K435DRAFT_875904 [Dendrothele bispora CBS 962.96]
MSMNQQPQQSYATCASMPTLPDPSCQPPDGGNGNALPGVGNNPNVSNTSITNSQSNTTRTYADVVRGYPNATNSYPNATNSYPNATNSYPNVPSYPNVASSYPNTPSSTPNAPCSTPNVTDSSANTTNSYPNATNSYPNATNGYPNASNTYPDATNMYPDSQHKQAGNMSNAGQSPVNLQQPPWTGMSSVNGFPTLEMGQHRAFGGGYSGIFNDSTNVNPSVTTNQHAVMGANANMVLNMSTNQAGHVNTTNNPNLIVVHPMGYYSGQLSVAWPDNLIMNEQFPIVQAPRSLGLSSAISGHSGPPFPMPQTSGLFMSVPPGVPDGETLDNLAEAVYKRMKSANHRKQAKGKKKKQPQCNAVDPSALRHAFNTFCGYDKGSRVFLPHPPGHSEYQPRYAPGSNEQYFDMHWNQAPRSDANLKVYEDIIVRMRAEDKAIVDPTARQFEKATNDNLKDDLSTYFLTRRKQYWAQVREEQRLKNTKRASDVRRNGRKNAKAARRRSGIQDFIDQNGAQNTRGIEHLVLTDVQSSEYSDSGNEKRGFVVLDLPWRSTQVTHLYRELDRLNDQESSTRWTSGKGGRGGLSRPRQPDQKNRVCRRPTPHRRPPAACVKRLYQNHENVKPDDANWTITGWLDGFVVDDSYDADSEDVGGVVDAEPNLNHVPGNSVCNSIGSTPTDNASTGGVVGDASAIASATEGAVGFAGVGSAPGGVPGEGNNSLTNVGNSEEGGAVITRGGTEAWLGVANVDNPASTGVGSGGLVIGAIGVDPAKSSANEGGSGAEPGDPSQVYTGGAGGNV